MYHNTPSDVLLYDGKSLAMKPMMELAGLM